MPNFGRRTWSHFSGVPAASAGGAGPLTPYLVERLVELRRYLDHLARLRPRIQDRTSLERDLSLHNDVLFSLLSVWQLVIDVAGDLSAQRGDRFEDHTQAVRNLGRDPRFRPELVKELELLPLPKRAGS